MFDSSPFKKKKTALGLAVEETVEGRKTGREPKTPQSSRRKSSLFNSPGGEDEEEEEHKNQHRRRGRRQDLPKSIEMSPSTSSPATSPEILRSFDPSTMDGYVSRLAQRQQKPGLLGRVRPQPVKARDDGATEQEQEGNGEERQPGGGRPNSVLVRALSGRASHLFAEYSTEPACFSESDHESWDENEDEEDE